MKQTKTIDAAVESAAILAYNKAYAEVEAQAGDELDAELAGMTAETYVREGEEAAAAMWSQSLHIPSGCDFCCGGATGADAVAAEAQARVVVAIGIRAGKSARGYTRS